MRNFEHFCCCSVTKSCLTLWNPMNCSMPDSPSQSLLKFMSIESVILSKHLILCRPLLLIPSVFLSIRVFSSEPALCLRWPKYWSFSVNPSNECSGLIPLGLTSWISLLSKSLLQYHNSKASNFSTYSSLWFNLHVHIPDYWKNHSFDYTDLCQQSDVSAF